MPELAYAEGGELAAAFPTLWDMLSHGSEENPHGAAITVMYQPYTHHASLITLVAPRTALEHPPYLSWTYSQLKFASLRVAGALRARGAVAGQTLVTFVENSIEWAVIFWAAARLGVTIAALDAGMPERSAELKNTLELLKPDILLLQNSELEDVFRGLLQTSCIKLVCTQARSGEWNSLDSITASHQTPLEDRVDFEPVEPEHPVIIIFTSGTTNAPKGCPVTISALSGQCHSYVNNCHLDLSTRFLLQTPNFRAIGQQFTVPCWHQGAEMVMPAERFDPDATLNAMMLRNITHVVMLPSMIHALRRSPLLADLTPGVLQYVWIGGDIITEDLLQTAKDTLAAAWTGTVYGMTEGGGAIGWTTDQKMALMEGGICGLGHVLAGCRVQICTPGTTSTSRRGEKGELHVSSPPIISQYLQNRDSDSFYHDEAGRWFKTGDLAIMKDSGVVFMLGRSKDIIKCRSLALSPAVFEGYLNRMPGVESQVIGMPHEELGEVPVAIIKCDKSLDDIEKAEIKSSMSLELGSEYTASELDDLQKLGLDDWPINASGKVVKAELKEILQRPPEHN